MIRLLFCFFWNTFATGQQQQQQQQQQQTTATATAAAVAAAVAAAAVDHYFLKHAMNFVTLNVRNINQKTSFKPSSFHNKLFYSPRRPIRTQRCFCLPLCFRFPSVNTFCILYYFRLKALRDSCVRPYIKAVYY